MNHFGFEYHCGDKLICAMQVLVSSMSCFVAVVSLALADIYFPPSSTQQQQQQQTSHPGGNNHLQLGPAANLPPVLSQEDAINIERYLRNYDYNHQEKANVDSVPPINLALLNNRSPLVVDVSTTRKQAPSATMLNHHSSDHDHHHHHHHQPTITSTTTKLQPNKQQPKMIQQATSTSLQRSDTKIPTPTSQETVSFDPFNHMRQPKTSGESFVMKSHLLFDKLKQPVANGLAHHQAASYPSASFIGAHPPTKTKLLAPLIPPDCISQSTGMASRCEDHLVKRLNQDATEGRTVTDVSRRVCCALFHHKDCISRIVVERCPDSSPAAVDILMGSRNLDLTFSCQRFNRDGCNGATGRWNLFSYDRLYISMISLLIGLVASRILASQTNRINVHK